MSFAALRIDALPLDEAMTDAAAVGPELAHSAHAYLVTPRALVWRNPSSEWPLLLVLLPLATRLTLMTNPIFGRLVRDWGHGIRFIGVDAEQSIFDFRELLDGPALTRLLSALASLVEQPTAQSAAAASIDHPALDTLFAVLGSDMLTILDNRRDDWRRHLAREHRLTIDRIGADLAPGGQSLFDRRARFPDFMGLLRQALRLGLIDIEFYGRVLRSIDLREDSAEARVLTIIEGALDPIVLAKLARTRVGAHLGCYNWLRADPRTASHRMSLLHKLPLLAQFVSDRMVGGPLPSRRDLIAGSRSARVAPADEAALRALSMAIDSGQDRAIVVAVACCFGVTENVIRALWRHCPSALGAPPEWHLRQILLALNERPERSWPLDCAGWLALKAASVPATVASP